MLDILGKTLLVSIRRIDDAGHESFDTFFCDVLSFNENTVSVKRHGGTEISLPYDEDVYEPAEPGFYELKDGTTYENPDFVAQWTVFSSEKSAEAYKHLNR